MSGKKLSKDQRKAEKKFRRERKNKRSVNAGQYGTGKTEDRKSRRDEIPNEYRDVYDHEYNLWWNQYE